MTTTSDITSGTFAERVLAALPVAYVVTDLAGRVAAVSDSARELLGVGSAPIPMRYEHLPLPEWARKPEMAQPALLAHGSAENVRPLLGDDGSVVGAVQILQPEGELAGEKLCAAMAHEIRNPLTGIQGFADLLRRDLHENDSRSALLAKIISGVQTINGTVSAMLDFCRPRPLRLEQTDLLHVAQTAVELSGCTSHLNVAVDVPPDCRRAWCDRLQMLQALVNLVRNAAEATPDGGSLAISARRRGASVQIVVADTGRGMDAAAIAGLFKPFASAKPGGSGLGLLIVKRIMQHHNGDVCVRSHPGKGTRITLTLPAEAHAAATASVPHGTVSKTPARAAASSSA